ncbi:phosphatidylethanolamine N-methyltransferase isoform X7 [Mirounga leonina]|uniref:phosphatidylethanolamine N-methyltransferase isoform X7 n=2 Tax=Mirounga leonina TaxID=9715 RepID=UPI00156C4B4E|nr:phosphatidylethanolamine N-methyltransferase isoform X7 [Mirounga leonina]
MCVRLWDCVVRVAPRVCVLSGSVSYWNGAWRRVKRAEQADLCVMTRLLGYVDPSDPRFVAAILTITFNPLFWNVVARWEQKTRKLSRAFRSPYLACYSLGAVILLLNILRSHWRLLRDPQGGKGDHVPIQRPGQPHVLGQHGQLPGLGCHARQPHRPAADRGCGPRLHGRHPVRGALHHADLPAESLPVPQEELTGPSATSRSVCRLRPAPSAKPCSGETGPGRRSVLAPGEGHSSALEISALGALDMLSSGH